MDRYDFAFASGLALLTGGLYFVFPPLALIVPGVILIAVGLVGAWRKGGGS